MAIAVIGSASVGYASSTAESATFPVTVSHTQPAGSDRILEVTATLFWDTHLQADLTLAATYNGVAMTQVVRGHADTATWGVVVCKFILKEASLPSNAAHDVVVTATIGVSDQEFRDMAVVCRHLSGVDQTTTTRDTDNTASGTAGTSASLSLTTESGDLVTDGLWSFTTTRTIGAGQSVLGTQVDGTDNTDCHCSYEEASGVSVTMSWTFTSQQYGLVAVAYIPAAGGGGGGGFVPDEDYMIFIPSRLP